MNARPIRYPLTIFYDASCPMCAHEMHALKARDAAGRLLLVDCSASDFDDGVLAGTPIRREDLMTLIHARDAGGHWLAGLDVFELAYRAAGLERLAGFWGSRHLRPILARLYPWIAKNRQFLSRLGVDRLVRRLFRLPCNEHDACKPARWSLR